MSNLYRFMIDKPTLEALPDRERSILLGGGKLLNEMNISTNHLHFSMNAVHATEDGPDRRAAFTALSFFLRILAGHVFEAYEYFRNNVRVDDLKSSFLENDDFCNDTKALKKYFGRKNIITKMRNQFAFHTDTELLHKSLKSTPPAFIYEVLLGKEHQGHNLFYGSEVIIIHGIQHLPDTPWEDAINAAFNETIEIAILISTVFRRIIRSILVEHLKLTTNDAELVTVTDGPPINTVLVPFFCQPPAGGSGE